MFKRCRIIYIFFILIVLIITKEDFANAQSRPPVPSLCMPDTEIKKILKSKYNERSAWRGITKNGKMVELFVAEKPNRTWTIIYWLTPNFGCIVDVGANWHSKVIHYLGDEL